MSAAVTMIEATLEQSLAKIEEASMPPRLRGALRHAVMAGGGRLRPRLCLAVIEACGGALKSSAYEVAAIVEILHCASLVHDDLPCFDNAATRRGRPAVHIVYGEPLAVLTGDGLIALAFESLGRLEVEPKSLAKLLKILGQAIGAGRGLIAGQAWESEVVHDLGVYHRAKAGALFRAAAAAGAVLTKADADAWGRWGEMIGEAYQIADDICDAYETEEVLGKPVRQDAMHGRPNAVSVLGFQVALRRLHELPERVMWEVPKCSKPHVIGGFIREFRGRLEPRLAENDERPRDEIGRPQA